MSGAIATAARRLGRAAAIQSADASFSASLTTQAMRKSLLPLPDERHRPNSNIKQSTNGGGRPRGLLKTADLR